MQLTVKKKTVVGKSQVTAAQHVQLEGNAIVLNMVGMSRHPFPCLFFLLSLLKKKSRFYV